MTRFSFVAALVGLLCSAWLHAEDTPSYMLNVNGEETKLYVRSLNATPDGPQPGDLAYVSGFWLPLSQERRMEFRLKEKQRDVLYAVQPDGTERIAGVSVSEDSTGDKRVLHNPLEGMKDEDLRALRSVRLGHWSQEIAAQVAKLDTERVAIEVLGDAIQANQGVLPPMPKEIRYLCIRASSSMEIKDLSPLAGTDSLVFFHLYSCCDAPFNLVWLSKNAGLRYLNLGGERLANVNELVSLTNLRYLDLQYVDEVKDIGFARQLASLREVDLTNTGVEDLRPLAGLKELADVSADSAPVQQLPEGEMPGLRKLRVMSTKLTDASVERFSKANPRCKVVHRWGSAFRDAVSGTTRIRVRTGGTCHTDPTREKTIFEVSDAEGVKQFIAAVKLDEARSNFHCMCCGSPTFELYKDKELLLSLGFHHGRSLRWPGGWPGDGLLIDASGGWFCDWLADHGIKGPKQEREEEMLRAAAMERRTLFYQKTLPEKVLKVLDESEDNPAAVAKAFTEAQPDTMQRVELLFRLYGCDNGSWNHYGGMDELLREKLLPSVGAADLATAARKLVADPMGGNGVARWVLGDQKWESLSEKDRPEIVALLARVGLSHPREICRRRAVYALAQVKGEPAIIVLKAALNGELKPRELPKGDEAEAGNQVCFCPGDSEVPKGCSDATYAGLVLARWGVKDCLGTLRELVQTAKEEEKKILEEAVDLLSRSP